MKSWGDCRFQRLLVPLFTFVWWNRLVEEEPHSPYRYRRRVIKVKGWGTALVDGFGGQRSMVTFMKEKP